MTAVGHQRHFERAQATSGLPPIPDMSVADLHYEA
jgi:hypothetical protein